MSIIEIYTDREPSKLDERLKEFKDPETGHIMLSPERAKDILFKSLLSFYKASVTRPTPMVEALVQITKAEPEGERFDLTEALEKFVDEAERERKAQEERKFGKGGSNIIRPTPRVRGI